MSKCSHDLKQLALHITKHKYNKIAFQKLLLLVALVSFIAVFLNVRLCTYLAESVSVLSPLSEHNQKLGWNPVLFSEDESRSRFSRTPFTMQR